LGFACHTDLRAAIKQHPFEQPVVPIHQNVDTFIPICKFSTVSCPQFRLFSNIYKNGTAVAMWLIGGSSHIMQTSAANYKTIGLMGLIFAVAILGVSVISAHGQAPWYGNGGYYGNQNGRYSRVSQRDMQKAYEKGYKQGEKDGKNDAKNHRGSYSRNAGYGTYGNNGRYGNGNYGGGQLQRAFQDGYQRGYRDGYDRNARYNRNSRTRYGNRSVFGIPLPY